jgi:hypothetical protein
MVLGAAVGRVGPTVTVIDVVPARDSDLLLPLRGLRLYVLPLRLRTLRLHLLLRHSLHLTVLLLLSWLLPLN